MRIAVIEKSATERLSFVQQLEQYFLDCRKEIGHLSTFQLFPASREEVLINAAPDVAVLGPGLPPESSYLVARDIQRAHPDTAIVIFIAPELYDLSTLQRFEQVSEHLLSVSDSAARIVHAFSVIASQRGKKNPTGKLITVAGVKGGVGTTSIVSGFAHSAQALGLSSIVIDLSQTGVLPVYFSASRRQSSGYASCLLDGTIPDVELVGRSTVTAPNGISLLLPPSGGAEIRELWLRDATKFEVTLAIVEILLGLYDIVLVDTAGAEGVLRYALACRAYSNVLVSSTDPASVHLLGHELCSWLESPGRARTDVIINQLAGPGLTKEDVLDYLYVHTDFDPKVLQVSTLKRDSSGRNWVGTGNSFYTESSRSTQKQLELILGGIINLVPWDRLEGENSNGPLRAIRRLVNGTAKIRKKRAQQEQTIPLLSPPEKSVITPPQPTAERYQESSGNQETNLLSKDAKIDLFTKQNDFVVFEKEGGGLFELPSTD